MFALSQYVNILSVYRSDEDRRCIIGYALDKDSVTNWIRTMGFRLFLLLAVSLLISGCATTRIPGHLSEGILSNDDLELVADGLPAYLLTMDGLVLTYPNSARVLGASAELHSAYAGVFVDDPERERRLTTKALDLAVRATCEDLPDLCDIRTIRATEAERRIDAVTREKHAPALYLLGSIWASYIQAHSDDWNAVADLAKAQRLLERQTTLMPGYNQGMGELYLAVMASLLPPSLGGQPEVARTYFEQAIEHSEGQNLIVKVYYAQEYARMMFDRGLHDSLLQQVLDADPKAGTLTLQNTFAQRQARALLASGDSYF